MRDIESIRSYLDEPELLCQLAEECAELLFLDEIGYSAEDIEIITPEEYDMVFGGDEDG